MLFALAFDADNAAFTDGDMAREIEINRLLREVASRVLAGETSGNIRDLNGNRVGEFSLSELE